MLPLAWLPALLACGDDASALFDPSVGGASSGGATTTGGEAAGASGNAAAGGTAGGGAMSAGGEGVGASDVGGSSAGGTGGEGADGAGAGGGIPCVDGGPGEPANDTLAGAHDLGVVGDNNDNRGYISGVLTPGDTDFYRYEGDDNPGGIVDPTRELITSAEVSLCKYARCLEGGTDVDCPGATLEASSADGDPGCCGLGGFDIGVDCGGLGQFDDSADIFIEVAALPSTTCQPYTLTYHY